MFSKCFLDWFMINYVLKMSKLTSYNYILYNHTGVLGYSSWLEILQPNPAALISQNESKHTLNQFGATLKWKSSGEKELGMETWQLSYRKV